MTTPKARALPLLEEALSILLADDSCNRDKIAEDHVRRAKNRIVRSIFWKRDEPSESRHVEETPFTYFATSRNKEGVTSFGIAIEEVF